ncbi:MAG: hypothetical protein WA937_07485 [Flavobacteriales bacterium]
MTHKAFRLLLVWCMVHGAGFPHHALAQEGLNNLWLGGFEDESPPPWGGVDLNFATGNLVISTVDRQIDFKRTNTNITDADGNILFSTNGAYIANATGDTMLNGGGLNPSWYTANHPEGLYISQGYLILPKPDAPGIYYLIHSTIDDPPNSLSHYLYLSTVDMALDDGLGAVTNKNQILIADTLNTGRITAVRHANGRDWWIYCFKANTNIHHRLLLSPNGVSVDGAQAIGVVRTLDHGQACFSPDGSRFAYYSGFGTADLEVFDFDRCTGLFSNPVQISINDANSMGGVAFAPNSRYLYVSSVLDVYQYDTEVSDIAATMVHIAHWDSTYSPSPPFATMFDIAQLAPDGKVYIGTGNGTLRLHVIHNPDEPGLACNLEQHGVELPRYFMNSLPNHPNYHLGAVAGSVCDSLGINTLTPALSQGEGEMRAFPNPSADGHFVLGYPAHAGVGWLEVRDIAGRVVLHERIPQWSTVHAVELLGQAAGMYNCTLRWGRQVLTTRVILTEP